MSLKSAISLLLAAAILLASLCGIGQPDSVLSASALHGQTGLQTPLLEDGIPAFHPVLACIGCSGNGTGPG